MKQFDFNCWYMKVVENFRFIVSYVFKNRKSSPLPFCFNKRG